MRCFQFACLMEVSPGRSWTAAASGPNLLNYKTLEKVEIKIGLTTAQMFYIIYIVYLSISTSQHYVH